MKLYIINNKIQAIPDNFNIDGQTPALTMLDSEFLTNSKYYKIVNGKITLDTALKSIATKQTSILEITALIKAKFLQDCENGIEYTCPDDFVVRFQCREDSCNRVNNALKLLELTGGISQRWRDQDNNWHTFTVEQFKLLAKEIGAFFYSKYKAMTELIESLDGKTQTELDTLRSTYS